MGAKPRPSVEANAAKLILDAVEADRDEETRFLGELVKVPSDNPPGDCKAHAERAAGLLEALGFKVERHPSPTTSCGRTA